jgi:hypothetical protein
MAKVEEIATAASGRERWEAERQATKLDKDVCGSLSTVILFWRLAVLTLGLCGQCAVT